MGNITVVTVGEGERRQWQNTVPSTGVGECFAQGRKCPLTEAAPFLSTAEEEADSLSYGVILEGWLR